MKKIISTPKETSFLLPTSEWFTFFQGFPKSLGDWRISVSNGFSGLEKRACFTMFGHPIPETFLTFSGVNVDLKFLSHWHRVEVEDNSTLSFYDHKGGLILTLSLKGGFGAAFENSFPEPEKQVGVLEDSTVSVRDVFTRESLESEFSTFRDYHKEDIFFSTKPITRAEAYATLNGTDYVKEVTLGSVFKFLNAAVSKRQLAIPFVRNLGCQESLAGQLISIQGDSDEFSIGISSFYSSDGKMAYPNESKKLTQDLGTLTVDFRDPSLRAFLIQLKTNPAKNEVRSTIYVVDSGINFFGIFSFNPTSNAPDTKEWNGLLENLKLI